MTRSGTDVGDLEGVFQVLQQSRVRLLRDLGAGRHQAAAEIGRTAVRRVEGLLSAEPPPSSRFWVPIRELSAIVAADVQVANAIDAGRPTEAIERIVTTYQLARTWPVSVDAVQLMGLVALAKSSATARGVLGGILRYPVAARVTSVMPVLAPVARFVREYVGQGPFALRACLPHGNPTITGDCCFPPCPRARR